MDLPEIKQFLGNYTIIFPELDTETRRYKATGTTDVKVVVSEDDTNSFHCGAWSACKIRLRQAIQVLSMTNYQYRIYCFCEKHGGRAREEIELLGFLEEHHAIAWPIPPEVILHP
jgi:hypothetical protein